MVCRMRDGLPVGNGQQGVDGICALMVLLYDRAFVGGSFREAWRRRYGLYLALAGAWVLLVFMVAWSGTRGKSSGFGIEVGCWEYFCTQFGAILNYLKLCVWPRPLVFDYGKYIAENGLEIAVCGVVVVFLGLATVVALVRWPKVGFLGAWFFAILPLLPASFRNFGP